MKIAIIECDVPMPKLKAEFGTYTDYFARLLRSSVTSEEAEKLEFVTYEAYLDAPLPTTEQELTGLDGVLITGSKYNSYDDTPWILRTLDLVRLLYAHRVRTVGICFGHQVIARALGGAVGPNPNGWEIAVTSTSTFDCALLPTLRNLRLQQMHRDEVTRVPEGATVVGGNACCAVQAMYEPGRYFAVQGHPEFDAKTVGTLVETRVEQGIVSEEYGRDALARKDLEHDGLVVGAAIIRFFEGKE